MGFKGWIWATKQTVALNQVKPLRDLEVETALLTGSQLLKWDSQAGAI